MNDEHFVNSNSIRQALIDAGYIERNDVQTLTQLVHPFLAFMGDGWSRPVDQLPAVWNMIRQRNYQKYPPDGRR